MSALSDKCTCKNGIRGKTCFDYHGKEERDMSEEKESGGSASVQKCEHGMPLNFYCSRCRETLECKHEEEIFNRGVKKGKAEIKSLESRLKEANNKILALEIALKEDAAETIQSLEQRLSQAEKVILANQTLIKAKDESTRELLAKPSPSLDEIQGCLKGKVEVETDQAKNLKFVNLMTQIDKLKSRLSQAEAELQKHKDETLDGDCERCDYKSFTEKVSEQCERIMELEHRLSHLMDVAGKLSHALGMVMKENHVDVKKPSEECLKEHFVILLPTEDEEEAKLALAEWDGIKEKK